MKKYTLFLMTILLVMLFMPTTAFAVHTLTADNVTMDGGTITEYSNISPDRDIIIPDTIGGVMVTGIGESAFHFKSLTSVDISATVTTISDRAFGSNNLTNVIIRGTLTSLGYAAFSNNEITSVTLISQPGLANNDGYFFDVDSSGVVNTTTISSYGGDDTVINNIPSGVTEIQEEAFYNCGLTTVNIPSTVQDILQSAFRDNSITNLTINGVLNNVGEAAFANNQLGTVVLHPSQTALYSNGMFYRISSSTINNTWVDSYGGASDIVAIPEGVEYIGWCAFSNCELIGVTLPSTLIHTGWFGFNGNSLTTLIIPDNVTYIEDYSFSGNDLSNVNISSSVRTIGWGAFESNNLTSVTIPNSVELIRDYAFASNNFSQDTPLPSIHQWLQNNYDGSDDHVLESYSVVTSISNYDAEYMTREYYDNNLAQNSGGSSQTSSSQVPNPQTGEALWYDSVIEWFRDII